MAPSDGVGLLLDPSTRSTLDGLLPLHMYRHTALRGSPVTGDPCDPKEAAVRSACPRRAHGIAQLHHENQRLTADSGQRLTRMYACPSI
jgi:hypothetical protein